MPHLLSLAPRAELEHCSTTMRHIPASRSARPRHQCIVRHNFPSVARSSTGSSCLSRAKSTTCKASSQRNRPNLTLPKNQRRSRGLHRSRGNGLRSAIALMPPSPPINSTFRPCTASAIDWSVSVPASTIISVRSCWSRASPCGKACCGSSCQVSRRHAPMCSRLACCSLSKVWQKTVQRDRNNRPSRSGVRVADDCA